MVGINIIIVVIIIIIIIIIIMYHNSGIFALYTGGSRGARVCSRDKLLPAPG